MRRFITALALCIPLLLSSASSFSQGAPTFRSNRVLTHREQAPLQARWIEQRFKTVLPALMRRERIDMWIIVSREYNDDPVFRSMSPVTTYSSRRRTILVFFDRGGEKGVEHLSIGRFDYDGLFTLEKTDNDGQWAGLRKVVEARDPRVIGVDTSELYNHADGLTATERDNLLKALGAKYAARVKSAEMLAVGWLDDAIREAGRHRQSGAARRVGRRDAGRVGAVDLLSSDRLPRPRGRTAHRDDRLSGRRAGAR